MSISITDGPNGKLILVEFGAAIPIKALAGVRDEVARVLGLDPKRDTVYIVSASGLSGREAIP